jgi:hypothetical protein
MESGHKDLSSAEGVGGRVPASVIPLVLANLVPLAGVLFFGWELLAILLLFWLENVIIGIFNVLKMAAASGGREAGAWGLKLFLIPFFCVHYGMFTMVHGMFVIVLFGGSLGGRVPAPGIAMVQQIILENHLVWGFLGLCASHGFSFFSNYLGAGEYRKATVMMLMGQPYGRILLLHFTILIGGAIAAAFQSPTSALMLLVVLKTALDVRAHLKEHQKFAMDGERIGSGSQGAMPASR